jgi:hypothetical protein
MTKFSYAVVGIRPEAALLHATLKDKFHRDGSLISFDGRVEDKVKNSYNLSLTEKIMRRPLSDGEYGCAMGHLIAYQLSGDFDWLIILEDDIRINLDPLELEQKLGSLPKKPMLVHLGDLDPKKPPVENFLKYPWYHRPYYTHAYAVNRLALTKIREHQNSIITTADWPIQWKYQFPFFNLIDPTFELDDLPSLLENERVILQQVQHSDFARFQSRNSFTKLLSYFRIKKLVLGLLYFLSRIKIYLLNLDIPLLPRIKTAVAQSYSDLM